MLREIESNTSIEEHQVDEVNDTALKRYRYRTAICLLFCYVCHVAFCNCVLVRAVQLYEEEDSSEFFDNFAGYVLLGCTYFGGMMCMVVPAECLMKRSKWKLKALVLCSIYLILIDPALLCASGLLLNLFPSVKSWSQDDITKYTFWEACAMCPFVACVPIPVIFKLAFKRVPHQEKEAASSLDGYDRVSGTDAEPQGNSFGWKLCKVFYIYCSLCSLAQAFLAISSYPDLVKSELFGKSTLYSRALVGTLFFQSVALLCSLFCNFYILNSGERRELYLAGAISLCSYNFLYICHDYIVVAVGLEN